MNIRSSFHALVLGGALLVLALPSAAMAAEVRNSNTAVVAPDETLNDDLFATGQTVTVAGHVIGDVYAGGQTVVVTGTVDGDLIAGAQQVVVDGTVNGNVRAVGGVVTVNGRVGHSVTSLGQQVNVSSSGRVDGSLVAAGETISVFGPVGRGITAGGGTLQFGGPVGGEVLAWAQTLSIGPSTRIAGNLEYHSEHQAEIPSGTVAGRVQFDQIQRQQRQEPLLNGLFDFGGLVWLVGSAILGRSDDHLCPTGIGARRRARPTATAADLRGGTARTLRGAVRDRADRRHAGGHSARDRGLGAVLARAAAGLASAGPGRRHGTGAARAPG